MTRKVGKLSTDTEKQVAVQITPEQHKRIFEIQEEYVIKYGNKLTTLEIGSTLIEMGLMWYDNYSKVEKWREQMKIVKIPLE